MTTTKTQHRIKQEKIIRIFRFQVGSRVGSGSNFPGSESATPLFTTLKTALAIIHQSSNSNNNNSNNLIVRNFFFKMIVHIYICLLCLTYHIIIFHTYSIEQLPNWCGILKYKIKYLLERMHGKTFANHASFVLYVSYVPPDAQCT